MGLALLMTLSDTAQGPRVPSRRSLATVKQRSAARRNIKKAAAAARRKRTLTRLPAETRKALGKFFHALTSLMREHAVTAIYNFENPELLGLSSMMGEVRASSLVDNIILMNWVELGDTFRHALTIGKVRGMPTNRVTHECEIIDGRGMVVLPRAVRLAVPSVPFASYYGLLSRAPERHRGGETPPGAQ